MINTLDLITVKSASILIKNKKGQSVSPVRVYQLIKDKKIKEIEIDGVKFVSKKEILSLSNDAK